MIVLFFAASNFAFSPEETVEVSSTEKLLPIYKVKTEEKNVALTMNCAWNADDIDKILGILDENEVKITFFYGRRLDWQISWICQKDKCKQSREIPEVIAIHPHVNNLTYEKNIERDWIK